MPMIGDVITYKGDGNNGTVAGTLYAGTLSRVTDPGGWGPTDVTVNVAGTPTLILNAPQDTMLTDETGTPQPQPNGSWRMVV